MEEIVCEYLKLKGLLQESNGILAKNENCIQNNSVILKGNKLGLIMLADYFVQVALNDTIGHHIHLDLENFFDKGNFELIIAKE